MSDFQLTPTTVAALIGAAGMILAAIVTGVFIYLSKHNETQPITEELMPNAVSNALDKDLEQRYEELNQKYSKLEEMYLQARIGKSEESPMQILLPDSTVDASESENQLVTPKLDKVIIGIPDISNALPSEELEKSWMLAIKEGFKNIGVHPENLNFKLVYFADLLYKYPLHTDDIFKDEIYYDLQPYAPAAPGSLVRTESNFLKVAKDLIEGISKIDGEYKNIIKKSLIENFAGYYDANRIVRDRQGYETSMRTALIREIHRELEKAKSKKGIEVMVIAHGYGSVAMYDALMVLKNADNPLKVSNLITIGSPLGMPFIKYRLLKDWGGKELETPTSIRDKWVNFSDRSDSVALDSCIRDDFDENSHGLHIKDTIVTNTYESQYINGEAASNPHSVYGYLRAPEVSKEIYEFLK